MQGVRFYPVLQWSWGINLMLKKHLNPITFQTSSWSGKHSTLACKMFNTHVPKWCSKRICFSGLQVDAASNSYEWENCEFGVSSFSTSPGHCSFTPVPSSPFPFLVMTFLIPPAGHLRELISTTLPLFLGTSWTSAGSDAGRKKYLRCFLSSKSPLRPRLTVHVHFTRRPWTPSWSSSWSPSWMLWCTLWLQSVASISRRWPAGWEWREERMSPLPPHHLYDGVFKELHLN